ncbi:MAG: hypothetical protein OEY29_15470 [Gammaproteobacteria bacterium]|nr:hypothetical protein [Gammaproteobacteria bacterium]
MTVKKLLSIAILAMLSITLIACGSSSSSSPQTTTGSVSIKATSNQ